MTITERRRRLAGGAGWACARVAPSRQSTKAKAVGKYKVGDLPGRHPTLGARRRLTSTTTMAWASSTGLASYRAGPGLSNTSSGQHGDGLGHIHPRQLRGTLGGAGGGGSPMPAPWCWRAVVTRASPWRPNSCCCMSLPDHTPSRSAGPVHGTVRAAWAARLFGRHLVLQRDFGLRGSASVLATLPPLHPPAPSGAAKGAREPRWRAPSHCAAPARAPPKTHLPAAARGPGRRSTVQGEAGLSRHAAETP